jgi:membrane fusion protein, multidrug efflux system
MPQKKKIIVISAIVLLIALLVFVKVITGSKAERGNSVPSVEVGKIQRGEIVNSEKLTGDILPIQQADIYSKVSGNIENIFVDIGDRVEKGQLLALIDTTIYSSNARQAEANYYQAKVNYENNKLTYERNLKLSDEDLIAKQDLDNSKTAMDASSAQMDAAKASYSNALTQLSYCKVSAPFSGYITKRNFDPGTYITGSGNTQNSSLFTLMNVEQLKSIVNVPENDVPLLNSIVDIEVVADALPGKTFKAKLKKISESVDLLTRTMAVEIDIENASKELKPGMFASITLVWNKKENAMILPDEVVLNDDRGDYVYTVGQNNVVDKKYVKVGIRENNKYEILSGINENERVVFTGQTLIKDQTKVRIVK